MFKTHSVGHPLNAGELKVLEGTHGTQWDSGEVGLEKHTKNKKIKLCSFKLAQGRLQEYLWEVIIHHTKWGR